MATKKDEKKPEGASVADSINAFFNKMRTEVNTLFGLTNALVTLKDGGSMFIDTTVEAPAPGQKGDAVYTAEDKATVQPNGDYVTESGYTVTVLDGKIDNVVDPATNEAEDVTKELENLRAENAKLKEEAVTAATNSEAEIKKIRDDVNGKVTALQNQVNKALGTKLSVDPDLTNHSGKITPSFGKDEADKPKNAIERKREREEAAKEAK